MDEYVIYGTNVKNKHRAERQLPGDQNIKLRAMIYVAMTIKKLGRGWGNRRWPTLMEKLL